VAGQLCGIEDLIADYQSGTRTVGRRICHQLVARHGHSLSIASSNKPIWQSLGKHRRLVVTFSSSAIADGRILVGNHRHRAHA
jgi:hypothetical protein